MNKYSQIQSTPFVPTYAPPDTRLLLAGAQNLRYQNERGMQAYDNLQSTLSNIDVLEQDKPIIDAKVNEINTQLAEFTNADDFIDAMPAIRKAASNLQQDIVSGSIGKARQNKLNAMQSFKNIDESNWSPQQKEIMKNKYLSGYRGAEEGGLNVFTPAEYVNVEEEANKLVKGLPKQTVDTFEAVQTPDGVKTAKKRTSGITDAQVNETISTYISSPEVIASLAQEAELRGVAPSKYINDYASTLATALKKSYGVSSVTFDNIQWKDESGANSRFKKLRELRGVGGDVWTPDTVIQDLTIVPKGKFSEYQSDYQTAIRQGNNAEAATLIDGLKASLVPAIQQGKITTDDMNYLIDNFSKSRTNDLLNSALFSVGIYPNPFEAERDNRFNEIYDRVEDYIDEANGVISNSVSFSGNSDKIKEVFKKQTATIFDIINDGDEIDDMNESEKNDFINKVLQEGTPQGITLIGENTTPYYRFSIKDEDDTYKTVYLQEKSMENLSGYRSPFIEIADLGLRNDAVFGNIVSNYELAAVPVTGENIYNDLPVRYKEGMGGLNYISLSANEGGGITMAYGTPSDNKPFSLFNAYLSADAVMKNSTDQKVIEDNYTALLNILDKANSLSQTEKNIILENLNNVEAAAPEIYRKLANDLSEQVYVFPNKLEPLNLVTANTKNKDSR